MCLKPQILASESNVKRSISELLQTLENNLLELMNKNLERISSAETMEEEKEYMSSFEFFAKYLINIKKISSGSIVWSLVFTSVDTLDVFWNAYLSGHLKEKFEKDFITQDLLADAELEAAEFEIYVSEEDFMRCKEELKGSFVYIFPSLDWTGLD